MNVHLFQYLFDCRYQCQDIGFENSTDVSNAKAIRIGDFARIDHETEVIEFFVEDFEVEIPIFGKQKRSDDVPLFFWWQVFLDSEVPHSVQECSAIGLYRFSRPITPPSIFSSSIACRNASMVCVGGVKRNWPLFSNPRHCSYKSRLSVRDQPAVFSKAVRLAIQNEKPGTPSMHLLADDTR